MNEANPQAFEKEENCHMQYDPEKTEERKCWACMGNPHGRECFNSWYRAQETERKQGIDAMSEEEKTYFSTIAKELKEEGK